MLNLNKANKQTNKQMQQSKTKTYKTVKIKLIHYYFTALQKFRNVNYWLGRRALKV